MGCLAQRGVIKGTALKKELGQQDGGGIPPEPGRAFFMPADGVLAATGR
ncbi:hypothetical protein GTU79_24095 [Sodalis ligni]|nr:hypothetical protein [Sodalis ligni]QWA10287.1 hypothetical protein GTU79_24095 [Sodalis ligni]